MSARVCVLVEAGDVPGRNPLLPPLRAVLAGAGVGLVTWDPTRTFSLTATSAPAPAPEADLYLVKGDHPAVLTAATCLADRGAPCLNPADATAAVADKARALARVAAAGVRVPETLVVSDVAALSAVLDGGPRFVKPVRGAHGTGARLLGPGEAGAATDGPWLVQEPIPSQGYDIKTYGVGDRVAVRRARFVPGVVDLPREPVDDPDPRLAQAAVAASRACGLTLFGADFLLAADGPVLIDLNAFPGYRGVDQGPHWVADAVLAALRAG